MPDHNSIFLSGPDVFYPQQKMDAYRVEEGQVFVYIVPMEKGQPGRRILLCEAGAGRVIPALVYRDQDYKSWRFALVAKGEHATLVPMPNKVTSALHRNFLAKAQLMTYAQEGFEGSLTEFYKREDVKDKAYIEKAQNAAPKATAAAYSVVQAAFEDQVHLENGGNDVYHCLQFLCGKMGISLVEPEELTERCGKDPTVAQIAAVSHFICRQVVLEEKWYTMDCGGFVGQIEGKTVACLPMKYGRYYIFYPEDNRTELLSEEVANTINPRVWSIGRTLPLKKLTRRDVFSFCKKSLHRQDMIPVVLLAVVTALIGFLLPTLNKMIYDDYIPLGEKGALAQICLVMLSFMVGNVAFSVVKNLFDFRATSRVANALQNAAYHRLFHLPEAFFRKYDSADLGTRMASISTVATDYTNALVISSISALVSVVYLIRMWTYSGKLAAIALAMYAGYTLLVVWLTAMTRKGEARISEAAAQAGSRLYQYLNGVDKIRMAGVEECAILTYMQPYAQQQSEEIKVNRVISVKEALATVISSIFSMVLYLVIVKKKIDLSVGAFVALNTAFGSFCAALQTLADQLLKLYQEKSLVDRFWPVFEAVPEDDDHKELPGTLSGGLSLEHVKFAYDAGGKTVLNDLSLQIRPGEYVGIVGTSGCGKSTLLKLMLGFETPQSGIVSVDGKDLRSMNKGAYRKQLGVVLQNGKLISGSIYENITITAPNANMKRVNEVIDQVGLREDIDRMPMGIHTVLSENCNTISGGQLQRILIARAIIGAPKILIFDEATSALDNLTQAVVSGNLDKMQVTRIVVAHRLSTIKNCDRILVLDQGNIAEEGTYRSLMEKRGLFYQLASRQIAQ